MRKKCKREREKQMKNEVKKEERKRNRKDEKQVRMRRSEATKVREDGTAEVIDGHDRDETRERKSSVKVRTN